MSYPESGQAGSEKSRMCSIECSISSKNDILVLSISVKQKALKKDAKNAERFNKVCGQKKDQRKSKHKWASETDENPKLEKDLLSANIHGDDKDGEQEGEDICESKSKDKRFRPGQIKKLR